MTMFTKLFDTKEISIREHIVSSVMLEIEYRYIEVEKQTYNSPRVFPEVEVEKVTVLETYSPSGIRVFLTEADYFVLEGGIATEKVLDIPEELEVSCFENEELLTKGDGSYE